MPQIAQSEGRRLFGSDPARYDAARPGHAERVYEALVERCALGPGTATLEIGPGTGQATRRLLELGAEPLVALEPDPALAAYLETSVGARVDIRVVTLEDAGLEPGAFDLAAAASSFHWVDEPVGLARLERALRPGERVALWWTLFGDPAERDAFIEATSRLLDDLPSSPEAGTPGGPRHALDLEARVQALTSAGFVDVEHEVARWSREWDTAGIRDLYATFSPIARLDAARREQILDGVAHIAEHDFGGRVRRTLLTALYTARKRA